MTSDDEEIDAWYLQGWCFFLMAQQVKETGQEIEGLGWQELAQDSRDCLDTCKNVGYFNDVISFFMLTPFVFIVVHSRRA